ncbi:type III PLP-dependent enzyme [Bacillus sp. RO1]|uniref:type III PLP-dependent enzyme n=1 Tax=Bacillus sp. RO1 TaxID=2722703 RepID=UPI001F0FE775|nr:type III PLP-dependent enzyme [Bacillus sp. RO1]
MLEIDQIKSLVDKLVISEEPASAYIYNLKSLRNHVQTIKESLPTYCSLYYAVKANPDQKILNTLATLIDGFDTASEGEVRKVKNLGKPVVLGAPAKKDKEISLLVDGTILYMNIESERDLHRINRLAEKAKKVVQVFIRVNVQHNVKESSHKMAGVATQFGIEESNIPYLLKNLVQFPYIEVKGFHFHAMSNNLNAKEHVDFIKTCLRRTLEWKQSYALNVEIVNAGGGIGINYENPAAQFDWNYFSEELRELAPLFAEHKLKMFLELGRYLTGRMGYYVSEVVDLKQNYGEWFAIIRGGSHHLRLPAAWKISHPFTIYSIKKWRDSPLPRPQIRGEDVTIAGELCTPNDILVRKQPVKSLKVGDLVIFSMAGAYAWTISHHDFLSHPHPQFYYIE